MPASPENEQLREASEAVIALGECGQSVQARSQELRALAEMRDSFQARREEMAVAVTVAHNALLKTLAPMVDDAGFNLVITSEEVTRRARRRSPAWSRAG